MSFTTRRGSAFYKRPLALIGATALTAGAMVPLAGAANAIEAGVENTCAGLTDDRFVDLVGYTQDTQDAINCLASYGVTQGTGDGTTYEPGRQVLRWEMALFLDRLITYVDDNNTDVSFADNDDTSTFDDIESVPQAGKEAIARLADLGIANGFSDEEYGPYNPVLRRQMASFLDRIQAEIAAQSPDAEDFTATMTEAEAIYVDVPPGHPQYEDIYSVSNAGIAEGTGADLFQPNMATTRSQMALFLTRHLDALVDQGVIEGEAVVPAPTQAFAVTPDTTATIPFGATPSADNSRTYTAAVPSGTVVDIALFPSANVNIDADGNVTFDDTDSNNVADPGTTTATITSVNGVPAASTDGITSNGSITFTITSTGGDDVRPVVWADAGDDNDIDLVAPSTANANPKEASDAIGVGGRTVFVPAEAPIGSSTPTVASADTDADYFTGVGGATYYWDSNDTFQYQGVGITQAQFESMINAGDVLSVNYNPDAAGVSVFNVTTDAAPTATAAPTVTVVNADGGATANDVRVTYTRPAANAAGTTYTLERASTAGPDGTYGTPDDVVGTWSNVAGATDTANADGTYTFADNNVPSGEYVYRVRATNPVSGTTTNGTASGDQTSDVVVPAPADTTAPTSSYAAVRNGGGLTNTIDNGDVVKIVFSESMAAPNAGDRIRVNDGDGTIADLVADTNATFSLNAASETVGGTARAAGTVLTITLTADPAVQAPGTTVGLQAGGTITDQSGNTDEAGNGYDIGGSADVTLNVVTDFTV